MIEKRRIRKGNRGLEMDGGYKCMDYVSERETSILREWNGERVNSISIGHYFFVARIPNADNASAAICDI